MELPETFFKQYCKKNTFFLIGGVPHNVCINQKSDDYFEWFGKRFGIEKGESFEKLETLYLESQRRNVNKNIETAGQTYIDPTLLELVRFAYEEVINNLKTELQKEIPVIKQLLQKDYFIYNGKFFGLSIKENGHASINDKRYQIGSKCNQDFEKFEKFEKKYEIFLEKRILEGANLGGKAKTTLYGKLATNGYYKEEGDKNIGFEKNEKGFFIYTIVDPYVLYEPKNECYYSFSRAKAGIRISKNRNRIEWEKIKVITPYMHPALQLLEKKPFQEVCPGVFNYHKLEKLPPTDAIKRLVPTEIKRMLQEGYIGQDSAWKPLYKYKEFERLKVEPGSFNPNLITNKRV